MTSLTQFPASSPFEKPPGCRSCPYDTTGAGFVPTWRGQDPKVAFLLEAPGQEEFYEREPLVGASGKLFFKRFIEPLGYTRNNVILANVLGCRPHLNQYPTGQLRHDTERSCRQYDGVQGRKYGGTMTLESGGLDGWDPTMFVCTYHPAFILRSWSLLRVLASDIEKAFRFAEQGERPLVLCGDKALSLVLPGVQVGPAKFRGTFGKLDWKKFKERS